MTCIHNLVGLQVTVREYAITAIILELLAALFVSMLSVSYVYLLAYYLDGRWRMVIQLVRQQEQAGNGSWVDDLEKARLPEYVESCGEQEYAKIYDLLLV